MTLRRGWRTVASGAAATAIAAPVSRPNTGELSASAADVVGSGVHEQLPPPSPLMGVRWSIPYVAFLAYTAQVITYAANFADVAVAVGLVALVFQRERIRVPGMVIGLGAFTIWCAISYVFTEWPVPAWERLTLLAKIWLVLFLAANALRTRPQIRLFIIVVLGCYALYPVRGALVNYFFYHSSLLGRAQWNHIYENPNDLAALTLLQLSLACGVYFTEPPGWIKRAALVGIGVLPLLILMTQSRGAFLALVVFAVVALVGTGQRLRAFLSRRLRSRLYLSLAGLAVIVVITAPKGVWDRVRGLRHAVNTENLAEVDEEGSARQRFEIWRVAVSVFKDQPVTGVGPGAYPYAHMVQARQDRFERIGRGMRDTHSTYLNVLAETGLPGFVIYFGLVIFTVLQVERVRKRLDRLLPRTSLQVQLLEFGLLAFLVAGIFGSFAQLTTLYMHLLLMWLVVDSSRRALSETSAPALPSSAALRRGRGVRR